VLRVGLRQGWRTFLTARANIFDNFLRNSFACLWEFLAAKWGLGSLHYYYIIHYILNITDVSIITGREGTK
jgi:hypothetical protein